MAFKFLLIVITALTNSAAVLMILPISVHVGRVYAGEENLLKAIKSTPVPQRHNTQTPFQKAMSRGFLALEAKKYQRARQAFVQARSLKPDSAAASDAITLVDDEYKMMRIAQNQAKAEAYAAAEKWSLALQQYNAALTLDDTLEFARQGKQRSDYFIKLHADLDFILNNPQRLTSDEPYAQADRLLKKVLAVSSGYPDLENKALRLDKLLKLARMTIRVLFESDGKTDVLLYKVGRLGRFTSRSVDLYPGDYTLQGRCIGYQDIIFKFTLIAGDSEKTVPIRCEETL